MTRFTASAEQLAREGDDPVAAIARFALEPGTPDAAAAARAVGSAAELLLDGETPEDVKDACTLAVLRGAEVLLPRPSDPSATAREVLKSQGWSAQAKRLAGSTLSDTEPDRETAHDIAGVAATIMVNRTDVPDLAEFSDNTEPELESLAASALARIRRD
ncbi:hypothetical protein [Nigerium massiliense]|uniref:hypothetical protein n=1 Tax=Nigerium massiliense TaxID=1522317 RepID=UPI00058B5691|nr:hypothetical protein [Nigerium massiliense]